MTLRRQECLSPSLYSWASSYATYYICNRVVSLVLTGWSGRRTSSVVSLSSLMSFSCWVVIVYVFDDPMTLPLCFPNVVFLPCRWLQFLVNVQTTIGELVWGSCPLDLCWSANFRMCWDPFVVPMVCWICCICCGGYSGLYNMFDNWAAGWGPIIRQTCGQVDFIYQSY